jgi:crotonobetainyl-CoA:carnitine CoA-transferase CaiB-like acyl-CoA transferase
MRFSDTPVVDPVAAPRLGEHTGEVLRELLGFDEARLREAAHGGAFGATRAG